MRLLIAAELMAVASAAEVVIGSSTCPRRASLGEYDGRCTLRCRRSALSVPPGEYFSRPDIGRNTLRVSPNKALLRLGGSRPRFLVEKRTSARRPNRDDHQQPQHHSPGQRLYSERRHLCRVGGANLRTLPIDRGSATSLRVRAVADSHGRARLNGNAGGATLRVHPGTGMCAGDARGVDVPSRTTPGLVSGPAASHHAPQRGSRGQRRSPSTCLMSLEGALNPAGARERLPHP